MIDYTAAARAEAEEARTREVLAYLAELEAIKARHERRSVTTILSEAHGQAVLDRGFLITLVEAARARADKAEAELAEVREAAEWAYDTLHEINVSNYDHDDVCRLNDASVEVILGLARALKGETR